LFSFSLSDSISIIPPPILIILNAILAFPPPLVELSHNIPWNLHNLSQSKVLPRCPYLGHLAIDILSWDVPPRRDVNNHGSYTFCPFFVLHMKYLFNSFCKDFHSYIVKLRIHVSKC
jgi:hypothetical protein